MTSVTLPPPPPGPVTALFQRRIEGTVMKNMPQGSNIQGMHRRPTSAKFSGA